MTMNATTPENANPGKRKGEGRLPGLVHGIMRVLPPMPLEIAGRAMLVSLMARRPEIFERLGEHCAKRFAIDPVDCPFVFLLEPNPAKPSFRVVRSLTGIAHDARIAGVMLVLLGLLDGVYDGDALFFSRDLVIEGDTAAVLALRNAIEDAELTPDMILRAPAVLAPFVNSGLRRTGRALRQALGAPPETPPPASLQL
jgi:predicted lipid carrier protein YhbT